MRWSALFLAACSAPPPPPPGPTPEELLARREACEFKAGALPSETLPPANLPFATTIRLLLMFISRSSTRMETDLFS